MENDKILIQDEQSFWDDVRMAIWLACEPYLSLACMRAIQCSVFRELHKYIKSDEVLLREVETDTSKEVVRPHDWYAPLPAWYLDVPRFRMEKAREKLRAQQGETGKPAAMKHRHDLSRIMPGWTPQPSQAEQGEAPNSAGGGAKDP